MALAVTLSGSGEALLLIRLQILSSSSTLAHLPGGHEEAKRHRGDWKAFRGAASWCVRASVLWVHRCSSSTPISHLFVPVRPGPESTLKSFDSPLAAHLHRVNRERQQAQGPHSLVPVTSREPPGGRTSHTLSPHGGHSMPRVPVFRAPRRRADSGLASLRDANSAAGPGSAP